MIDAVTSDTDITFPEMGQKEEGDLFQETVSPIIDEITQNIPVSHHEINQAVNEVREKVSVNGKISLSLLMAELKSECDRLDHINSQMTTKAQAKSEKKIKDLANKQALANKSKGDIAWFQLLGLALVSTTVLKIAPNRFDTTTQLTNTFLQHFGNYTTSYYEGENIRFQSAQSLEQSKYSDRNQKSQASQGGKQDRAQMLQQILQANLGAARFS